MRKFVVIFLFLVIGCATPQVSTYTKPQIDFSKYKKVAVIKFDCRESTVGQEVSDRIALSFMKKGYNVIERSQLTSVIDENSIMAAGLTEINRSALQLGGIEAVVVGSVTRYDCEQSKFAVFTGGTAIAATRNLCHASISIKMLNIQNGEVLWAGQGSHSLKGKNMTAGSVLQKLIEKIEVQMP
jgi:curli biogenesis system outer membrane secretion channel CsgG